MLRANVTLPIALALAAALSAQAPATQSTTELRIRVRPPEGETERVRLENARLLLAWWGGTEEVPLAHRYQGSDLIVTVPLGREVWASHGQAPDFAYVYLEFDEFVPVRSDQFHWLGGHEQAPVRFRFHGGPTVQVREGQTREAQLQVRRANPKQVRFVDQFDKPVSDITVDAGVFWSRNNHCGYPGGLIPFFEDRRPDDNGVLTIPDADVNYGFLVESAAHISIVGSYPHDPDFLNTYIDEPEKVIRIKRHRRVPLSMRVTIGGAPAPGVVVGVSFIRGCMNTTFPVGRTDAQGILRVPDFYPEEYEGVCIGAVGRDPVWRVERTGRRHIRVDLPAGTKVGDAVYCGPH